jgi:hypothetical protein
MRPLSQSLSELIALADLAVRTTPLAMPLSFGSLAAEIRREHALPADTIRCTYAAIVMLDAFDGLASVIRADAKTRQPWQMLIGLALPMLRAEAYQQFVNEKEARGS